MSDNSNARPSEMDEATILLYLRDLVTAGDKKLDAVLRAIAEAAQRQTGASGSAVAMWKEGAMVCRARSGETAPPIGAVLSSDTGISGECLRTGQSQHCADTEDDPRVDVEVCRTLGLRSIAVLPIQGWRGVNGILEVFSTEPGSFSAKHLAFLQQLAAVAERARAIQPHGASAAKPPVAPAEQAQLQGLLPASDRVRDVAFAFLGQRSRPLVLVGAVVAMLLIGGAIWLGWRGPAEASPRSNSLTPAVSKVDAARPPDNDPVWKPNPGGVAVPLQPQQKTSAGIPVQLASKIDPIASSKTETDQPLLTQDATAAITVPQEAARPTTVTTVEESVAVEPPPLPSTGGSLLGGLLERPGSAPKLSNLAISQGVTPGRLIRRVAPTYPPQALLLRLEGKVILDATIFEDGTVHEVSVVKGQPVLARAAKEAVERWRYSPYELDGQPVKTKTTITVDFKLPSDAPLR